MVARPSLVEERLRSPCKRRRRVQHIEENVDGAGKAQLDYVSHLAVHGSLQAPECGSFAAVGEAAADLPEVLGERLLAISHGLVHECQLPLGAPAAAYVVRVKSVLDGEVPISCTRSAWGLPDGWRPDKSMKSMPWRTFS